MRNAFARVQRVKRVLVGTRAVHPGACKVAPATQGNNTQPDRAAQHLFFFLFVTRIDDLQNVSRESRVKVCCVHRLDADNIGTQRNAYSTCKRGNFSMGDFTIVSRIAFRDKRMRYSRHSRSLREEIWFFV